MTEFLQFSLVPMLMGILSAVACALPGNFLVLRRQSLVGDAISHVVLPGIVAGFLLSGSTSPPWMLAGAGAAAVISALAFEAVRRAARVDAGAAMGVVFTAMFALGVVLLEQSDARAVHLDVEHALYGNLESHIWLAGDSPDALFDPAALASMPSEMFMLVLVALVLAVLTAAFFKELRLTTFDPEYARSIGLPAGAVSFCVILAAACAAVASFSAVGSILVIAMFICPPAAARLVTNDLRTQIWLSTGFAALTATLGFVLAGHVPLWLGFEATLSAAGMIGVMSGLLVAAAAFAGSRLGTLRRNA